MRVLVLGGTGAMGNHLVRLLSERGIETVVTTRSNRKAEEKITYIQGNALEIEFLKIILVDKWDAIIDFMVYSTTSFKERVHLLLTSTSQYVFLSSSRVYANSELPIKETSPRLLDVSEDSEFLSTDEYSLTKARQEDILKNSGLSNWTIIRPYITYSEDRLQLGVLEKEEWLYRAMKGRTIIFDESVKDKLTTLTYAYDVALTIKNIINIKNKSFGNIFQVACNFDKSLTWMKVLDIYTATLEKYLGKVPKVLFLDSTSFKKFRPEISYYQVSKDRQYDRRFNCCEISKIVEIDNFVLPEDGLKYCLEQFIENPHFKQIGWAAEALKDKYTGELTSLSEIRGIKSKINYVYYRFLKR